MNYSIGNEELTVTVSTLGGQYISIKIEMVLNIYGRVRECPYVFQSSGA